MSKLDKTYLVSDVCVKYAAAHSLRPTEVEKELQDYTKKNFKNNGMMGAPVSLHLMGNLMRIIGAKRVLDVGVFTGCSSLAAALAVGEQGEVHGFDINEDYVKCGNRRLRQLREHARTEGLQQKDTSGPASSGVFSYDGGRSVPALHRVTLYPTYLGTNLLDLGANLLNGRINLPDVGVNLPDVGVNLPDVGVNLPDVLNIFPIKIATSCNQQSDSIISAGTVNTFKNRLDKYWIRNPPGCIR
ncbi:O-methyltransferase family 3 [Trinorchestia longiramus]|nr:O-methyltransferase family 3 [Trinorchestia longiramus]